MILNRPHLEFPLVSQLGSLKIKPLVTWLSQNELFLKLLVVPLVFRFNNFGGKMHFLNFYQKHQSNLLTPVARYIVHWTPDPYNKSHNSQGLLNA
jgi:hypothetical protein